MIVMENCHGIAIGMNNEHQMNIYCYGTLPVCTWFPIKDGDCHSYVRWSEGLVALVGGGVRNLCEWLLPDWVQIASEEGRIWGVKCHSRRHFNPWGHTFTHIYVYVYMYMYMYTWMMLVGYKPNKWACKTEPSRDTMGEIFRCFGCWVF